MNRVRGSNPRQPSVQTILSYVRDRVFIPFRDSLKPSYKVLHESLFVKGRVLYTVDGPRANPRLDKLTPSLSHPDKIGAVGIEPTTFRI